MFLKLKNTTFQSITGKIYDFVTPLVKRDSTLEKQSSFSWLAELIELRKEANIWVA